MATGDGPDDGIRFAWCCRVGHYPLRHRFVVINISSHQMRKRHRGPAKSETSAAKSRRDGESGGSIASAVSISDGESLMGLFGHLGAGEGFNGVDERAKKG